MRARGGGIGFVYPGSNMQLVAETHIVMILYGAATLGAILLIKCKFIQALVRVTHLELSTVVDVYLKN